MLVLISLCFLFCAWYTSRAQVFQISCSSAETRTGDEVEFNDTYVKFMFNGNSISSPVRKEEVTCPSLMQGYPTRDFGFIWAQTPHK